MFNRPSLRLVGRIFMLVSLLACSACQLDPQTEKALDQAEKARVAMSPSQTLGQATTTNAGSASVGVGLATTKSQAQNPILFVTQVPTPGDPFASRLSAFANHMSSIVSVPRGGDLMIRYPDGSLRNLTQEAGFGMEGQQGSNAIAVREPAVHWDGQKALFSMVLGAPPRYQHTTNPWQIYEVTGLGQGQTATITKVQGQPEQYNNVSPIYDSNDNIIFSSDRPRDGQAHLHPQLDEYESTPTIVGLYRLNRTSRTVELLNHTPSGAFSPTIDSYGRVIFIRWDHLQRDQQADAGYHGHFDYASEAPNAANIGQRPEVFPESRLGMSSPYGQVTGFTYNLFTPWQMNQDGSDELTLNHIGRHELSFGYLTKSFRNDNALSDNTGSAPIANRKHIRMDGGLFNMREDPTQPGMFYGIYARDFGELSTGQLVRVTGAPTLNPEQMTVTQLSIGDDVGSLAGGRFRNPLPTSNGALLASYTPEPSIPNNTNFELRLRTLTDNGSGQFVPGNYLTPGVQKSVTWWDPDNQRSFSGTLWEVEPVEVVARPRPTFTTTAVPAPEKAIMQQEGIDEAALRQWMAERDLALVVVRNQTHRDRGDRQQPFNLRVPGGTSTTIGSGSVYDISHFQIFQANLIRGYQDMGRGRRPIAQPLGQDVMAFNPPNNGPDGSVGIASDGSSAAFVPARRALSWQTTDTGGNAIVRERVWVTMQPGEIRTCTGCHGENVAHQAGGAASQAQTQAVRNLLRHWKAQNPGVDPPPTCGAAPAPGSRTLACPAGQTGAITQTHGWVSAPHPTCWTAGPWTTVEDTCATPPPPPCGPEPAPGSRTVACPAGQTGIITQTHGWNSAPSPTCWTAGPWTTVSNTCVTPPPPPPPCGPKPEIVTRTAACPAGQTGQIVQSHGWVSAPHPTCWKATPWTEISNSCKAAPPRRKPGAPPLKPPGR